MDTKQNTTPEAFKVTGNWKSLSKKLKAKFAQLTESDLKFEAGKEDDLVTRISTRLHKKREEVIQLLNTAQLAVPNAL